MKNKLLWIGIILFLGVEIYLGMQVEPDLSHIGHAPHKVHVVGGYDVPMGGINDATIRASWIIMGFIAFLAVLVATRLKKVPGRLQLVLEFFVGGFDQLCRDILGPERGRKFLPFVASLFIFICLSNWSGMIPFHLVPEPTMDLNTPLALGVISFFIAHLAAIRYKGILTYIADYFEPWIEIKGMKIPNIVFFPLNVIGELGKLVSHSFRLYGNILGGVIIIEVVSSLVRHIGLPVFLNLFFGFFVGAVQAFVFSMLALTYVAVLVEE